MLASDRYWGWRHVLGGEVAVVDSGRLPIPYESVVEAVAIEPGVRRGADC